jgi:hypothetical protein
MEEDVSIIVEHPEKRQVVLPRGSRVVIDMVGACESTAALVGINCSFNLTFTVRNPNYFPDPDVFRPSRWYDGNDHDVMFGAGPRQCIGRRFAQSTAIRFLACFLRDFDIDILLRTGESRDEYVGRVMGNVTMAGTSLTLLDVPLNLTRRR